MPRLVFSLVIAVIAGVIGVGWGIDHWYEAQLTDREDIALSAYRVMGKELAHIIELSPDVQTQGAWLKHSALQPELSPYDEFPLPPDLRERFETGESLLLDSGDYLSLHYYLPAQQSVLSLRLPYTATVSSSLRWILTLLFYLGVVLVVLIWLYPLLQRLTLLRRSAQAFGAGKLDERITEDTNSYIFTIEQEFNRMAQRIEQLISDNKLLARGLSHDLRTPLARLRFGLDVLEEEGLSPNQRHNVDHLNRDLMAMEALVEAMLGYARLEEATISMKHEVLDLTPFVQELIESFYAGKINVTQPVTPMVISGDAGLLGMVLHNVLQNALHYGRGVVELTLVQTASDVSLIVEDDGPGISTEDRERLRKPFARGANTTGTEGHGLGLAIVERIAQWHRAQLNLSSSACLGGLKVTLTFPRK